MSYSTQRAVSDGTLQLLMLELEFFDKSEITAYFDSVQTTAFTWATSTSILFDAVVPTGVEVLLRRTTDLSKPRHVFTEGAQFKDSTLDDDFRQILHIAQEAVEGANIGDIFQDLDMHGNFIRNVANAVEPNDVVNLNQMNVRTQPAIDNAATALTNATNAASLANTAANQATAANTASANAVAAVANKQDKTPLLTSFVASKARLYQFETEWITSTMDVGLLGGWEYAGNPGIITQGNGNQMNYLALRILQDTARQETGVNGASGSKVNGLKLLHIFGGEGARGGRHALEANLLQGFGTGDVTDENNLDRNYVAGQFQMITMTGDGGVSIYDRRGAYFGISVSVSAQGVGRHIANLTGCEYNTYLAEGEDNLRVGYHSGLQIASDLRQRGYNIDAAISISNLGGSTLGWKYAWFLNGGNGRHPLDSDSTLIKVEPWGGGMDYALDVRGHTFSGAVVRSDKTNIGDGNIRLLGTNSDMIVGNPTAVNSPAYRMRSGGIAGWDSGISSVGGGAGLGGGLLVLEGSGVIINGTLTRPTIDNIQALGTSAYRFTSISATSGVINTSDNREKNIIGDLPYGLDVIEDLRTIHFRWKNGGEHCTEKVEDGFDTITEEVTETYFEDEVRVEIVDGKAVRTTVPVEHTRPVLDVYPMVDGDGEPVIMKYKEKVQGPPMLDEEGEIVRDAKGNITYSVQEVECEKPATFSQVRTIQRQVPRYKDVPVEQAGNRIHFGMEAQQVKEVIEKHNLGDFAGWTLENPKDPNSRQGLRESQFIPLLINAVKELSARVRVLEATIKES